MFTVSCVVMRRNKREKCIFCFIYHHNAIKMKKTNGITFHSLKSSSSVKSEPVSWNQQHACDYYAMAARAPTCWACTINHGSSSGAVHDNRCDLWHELSITTCQLSMLVGGDNSGTLSVARTATSSDVSYASIPPSVKLDNYRHVRLGLAEPTDDVTNRK